MRPSPPRSLPATHSTSPAAAAGMSPPALSRMIRQDTARSPDRRLLPGLRAGRVDGRTVRWICSAPSPSTSREGRGPECFHRKQPHTRPKPALDTLTNMTQRARSRFTGRGDPTHDLNSPAIPDPASSRHHLRRQPVVRGWRPWPRLSLALAVGGSQAAVSSGSARLGGPMIRHTGGSNGVDFGTFHNRFHGCGIRRGSGVNR